MPFGEQPAPPLVDWDIYPTSNLFHFCNDHILLARPQSSVPILCPGEPPPMGTDPHYDPADLAHPQDPKYHSAQPVAISLNAADDYF
jgi:hypothetical protein